MINGPEIVLRWLKVEVYRQKFQLQSKVLLLTSLDQLSIWLRYFNFHLQNVVSSFSIFQVPVWMNSNTGSTFKLANSKWLPSGISTCYIKALAHYLWKTCSNESLPHLPDVQSRIMPAVYQNT